MIANSIDGLDYTNRTLIFFILASVIYIVLMYFYFEIPKNIREETAYLSLFSVSNGLYGLFLIFCLYEFYEHKIRRREKKNKQNLYNNLKKQQALTPVSMRESPPKLEDVEGFYSNNSFEGDLQIVGTGFIFITFVFLLVTTAVLFDRVDKDEGGNLTAMVFSGLAFFVYFVMITVQVYERVKKKNKKVKEAMGIRQNIN